MATQLILYPYNMWSKSAIDLQEKLLANIIRVKRVRPDGNYQPFNSHKIINWGNSTTPNWNNDRILNSPKSVGIASNKLETFRSLPINIPRPDYTDSYNVAREWVEAGDVVLCRTKLNAHSGAGIVIAKTVDDLVQSPLYTKYKKKKNEYRVHVFLGTVLDVQEKRRDREAELDAEQSLIRNHQNGWVFCREDVNRTGALDQIAIDAVRALGLDFGAVDIIYNQREDKYYVLEVNTAPGLSGTTLDKYVEALTNYYYNN